MVGGNYYKFITKFSMLPDPAFWCLPGYYCTILYIILLCSRHGRSFLGSLIFLSLRLTTGLHIPGLSWHLIADKSVEVVCWGRERMERKASMGNIVVWAKGIQFAVNLKPIKTQSKKSNAKGRMNCKGCACGWEREHLIYQYFPLSWTNHVFT